MNRFPICEKVEVHGYARFRIILHRFTAKVLNELHAVNDFSLCHHFTFENAAVP